jgi:hypothetical protein
VIFLQSSHDILTGSKKWIFGKKNVFSNKNQDSKEIKLRENEFLLMRKCNWKQINLVLCERCGDIDGILNDMEIRIRHFFTIFWSYQTPFIRRKKWGEKACAKGCYCWLGGVYFMECSKIYKNARTILFSSHTFVVYEIPIDLIYSIHSFYPHFALVPEQYVDVYFFYNFIAL